MNFRFTVFNLSLVCALALSRLASADLVLDSQGDIGTIDGAIFYDPTVDIMSGGSNNDFLELDDGNDANDVAFGYNTINSSPSGHEDVDSSSALLTSDIPIVTLSGTDYREFAISINQTGSVGSPPLLRLTDFVVAQSATADVSDFGALTPIYTMSSMDVISHDTHSGANIDIAIYIPDSLFNASIANTVVFAGISGDSGGEERFFISSDGTPFLTSVPEPSSWAMMGLVLSVIAVNRLYRLIK